MSKSVSLSIKFNKSKSYYLIDIIKTFLKVGWNLRDKEGKVSYLPVGDKDDFEWQHSDILTDSDIFNNIIQKERVNEWVGIMLYWGNTDIGVTFLAESIDNVIVSPEINRKRFFDNFTDINWYINSIIIGLKKENIEIESFLFEEYF